MLYFDIVSRTALVLIPLNAYLYIVMNACHRGYFVVGDILRIFVWCIYITPRLRLTRKIEGYIFHDCTCKGLILIRSPEWVLVGCTRVIFTQRHKSHSVPTHIEKNPVDATCIYFSHQLFLAVIFFCFFFWFACIFCQQHHFSSMKILHNIHFRFPRRVEKCMSPAPPSDTRSNI